MISGGISIPPVDAPCLTTRPTPIPDKIPPKIAAKSGSKTGGSIKCWMIISKIGYKIELTQELIINLKPSVTHPTSSNKTLKHKMIDASSRGIKGESKSDIPATPPVKTLLGKINIPTAKASITLPANRPDISKINFFTT